jgi:hypothetical protein
MPAVVLAALLFCGSAYAQTIPTIQSALSTASFGLFVGPLDAATSVADSGPQPTFTKLKDSYFFGGLSNFGSPNFAILPTGSQFSNIPFILGYYSAGKQPWSVFGDALVNNTLTGLSDFTVVNTPASKTGPPNTSFAWNAQTTETKYAFQQAWNVNGGGQFIMNLGALNLGLILAGDYFQDASGTAIATWAANNSTTTVTRYYDTAAALVAPTPTVNYTDTTVVSKPDTQLDLTLGVPFYVPLGDVGLMIAPRVGYTSNDVSSSTKRTLSVPQGAAGFGPITPMDISIADTTGTIRTYLNSTLYLKPIFKGSPDNMLLISLNGSLFVHTASNMVSSQNFFALSAAGNGAAITTATGGQNVTTTSTRAGATEYAISPSIQHLLYFPLGPGATWAMGPMINLSLNFTPTNLVYSTQDVTVTSTDGSATGDQNFTDAADTITTQTTTRSHNNDGGTWNIVTGVSLPTAVTFQPSGAPFSVTVGGNVGIAQTYGIVTKVTEVDSFSTVTTNGLGVVTSPLATSSAPASYSNTSSSSSWQFTAQYGLDIAFLIPGDARIDVLFIAWTAQLPAFAIQGTIPMK